MLLRCVHWTVSLSIAVTVCVCTHADCASVSSPHPHLPYKVMERTAWLTEGAGNQPLLLTAIRSMSLVGPLAPTHVRVWDDMDQ